MMSSSPERAGVEAFEYQEPGTFAAAAAANVPGSWYSNASTPARSGDELIIRLRSQNDFSFRFELTCSGDGLLLCLADILSAYPAEHVHVFLQHLDSARRHRLENMLLHWLARSLERQCQSLLVHCRQQIPQRSLRHSNQILEGEHQVSNVVGQLGILFLERFQDRFGSGRFQVVHQPWQAVQLR